tara:strand:- start:882 stop:1253 length:372 start_codon:yes stop_codon:yes gene_type:complete
MAAMEQVQSITLAAGSDLSAGQFKFVLLASDGQVDLVASAGGPATGVLLNDPAAAGRAATVAYAGVVKVIAGGTVAIGAKVQSDAAGDAILAATGDHVLGVCVKGGADGELIEVLLISQHILA